MQILLDVWEGSLDIDESLLYSNGVAGLIIRLNDMNGGHHKDMTFDAQWKQAESFLRAPYFVYNPWVDGTTNFNWMVDHLPSSGVTRVMVDVEVRKADYSPEVYADQLQVFMDKAKVAYPKTIIYTGAWFLNVVSHWPAGDYWWARYPFAFYPAEKQRWRWNQLQTAMNAYGWYPDPIQLCPGSVKLWQLSGDKLILPGCADRPMDINIWNGDLASLEAWWGAELPPPPGPSLEEKVRLLWEQALLHGWEIPV